MSSDEFSIPLQPVAGGVCVCTIPGSVREASQGRKRLPLDVLKIERHREPVCAAAELDLTGHCM